MALQTDVELRCPGCGYGLCAGHGDRCPECGGATDGAASVAAERRRRRRRTVLAIALVLAVSYVPYCWILLDLSPWSGRGPGSVMWQVLPVMPGLLVAAGVEARTEVADAWLVVISGVSTLALLIGGVAVARRGPGWMAITLVILLTLNLFQSLFVYALSRM